MSLELIVVLALLTYASRAAALTLLPPLPPRVRQVLDRMPPALFAGLAAHSVVLPGGALVDGPILAATAGALLASPLRSLPACLVAGVVGYAAWGLAAPVLGL
jgi:branched-subunit amino acid transport protein